jgi:hypothetical protein
MAGLEVGLGGFLITSISPADLDAGYRFRHFPRLRLEIRRRNIKPADRNRRQCAYDNEEPEKAGHLVSCCAILLTCQLGFFMARQTISQAHPVARVNAVSLDSRLTSCADAGLWLLWNLG